MDYLKQILKNKKSEIKTLQEKYKDKKNLSMLNSLSGHGFFKNISASRVNIIAEIKKASPSKGIINSELDIEKTALLYNKYKSFISAISVITESLYFKGSSNFIRIVKKASAIPVLRKDFIFNENQVYESAELGADAILLISSILGQKKLNRLYALAKNLGLEVLIEAHNLEEFKKARSTGAKLIGINNRNLKNMEVDKNNIVRILKSTMGKDIQDILIVCESAVQDISYIKCLHSMGIRVFLIGSYFMQSKNLANDLSNMESALIDAGLI